MKSYEGLDDKDAEIVSVHNEENNYHSYAASIFKINDKEKETFFKEQIKNEIEVIPKTTQIQEVLRAMKYWKAL